MEKDYIYITHIGQGQIENNYNNLALNDVLIVPHIKKNLLSISKLTKDKDCCVIFTTDQFLIKDKQGQI